MKSSTLNTSATSSSNNSFTLQQVPVLVKTIRTKPEQEIDINRINNLDDLKSIKQQDPFMYYSIPSVRRAKVLMKNEMDIDTSNLGEHIPRRSRVSTVHGVDDSTNRQEQEEDAQMKVTRSTRISFECHPDLILEDIFNEMYLHDDLDDDDDVADPFAALTRQ